MLPANRVPPKGPSRAVVALAATNRITSICAGPELDRVAVFGGLSSLSISEPFSSCVCLAGLQNVDGLGELAGAPGAAAELAEDVPGLELGVRPLAG